MVISAVSYNAYGWRNGGEMTKSLCNSNDIILIQEHWLFPSTLHELEIVNNTHTVCSISGMNDLVIKSGRPYGGLAFI